MAYTNQLIVCALMPNRVDEPDNPMKFNQPSKWGWVGLLVLIVGVFLGGLDVPNHHGALRWLNIVGDVLSWIGIVALFVSLVLWRMRRAISVQRVPENL